VNEYNRTVAASIPPMQHVIPTPVMLLTWNGGRIVPANPNVTEEFVIHV
jgi:hypothetical protein